MIPNSYAQQSRALVLAVHLHGNSRLRSKDLCLGSDNENEQDQTIHVWNSCMYEVVTCME